MVIKPLTDELHLEARIAVALLKIAFHFISSLTTRSLPWRISSGRKAKFSQIIIIRPSFSA